MSTATVPLGSVRPAFSLLSVVSNIERHRLASGEAFVLLLAITYPGSLNPTAAQQTVRFARNPDPVTFDAGDGSGPRQYLPFAFELGDLKVSSQGSVPELDLKVSNVMRVLQTVIEQYSGVVGAYCNLYVVNAANPAGEPELAMSFTVKQTVCDAKLVTFKLGAASPLRRLFPLFMYRPNYCIWTFNNPTFQALAAAAAAAGNTAYRNPGKQCGYLGPMTTCSHTIDGATGCQAHGNLLRIGTFPGVDNTSQSEAGVA